MARKRLSFGPWSPPPEWRARRGPKHLDEHEARLRQLDRIEQYARDIKGMVKAMAVTQEQFDQDLAALVAGITALIAAIEAAIAARPPADLTAEDQAVQAAAAQVSDEVNKLNPSA